MLGIGTAAFLMFGVVLVLPGASQDAMARALGLDLTRSGLLGSALILGVGVGVVGAGPLCDRFPRRPLFVLSLLLAAFSCLAMTADTGYPRALLQLGLLGVGAGAYDTVLNALATERYAGRSARPLGLLHGAVTLGGSLGPFAVAALARGGDWSLAFRVTGAGLALLAAIAAALPLPRPPSPAQGSGSSASFASLAFLALGGVGFAYVGVETCLSLFTLPYAEQGLSLPADRGRSGISAFWLGILLSRIALLFRSAPLGARYIGLSGLAGGAVIALAVGLGWQQLEWAWAAAGLAVGGIYPAMIALTGDRFPHARGTAAGLVAGLASLGGFAAPWLTGALGDAFGIVPAIATLSGWCGLAALGAWLLWRAGGPAPDRG